MSKQRHKPVHRYVTLSDVDNLRDAAYDDKGKTAERDEALVVVMADFGLRVSEAVRLKRSMFDFENDDLQLPAHIQKDYPHEDRSPTSARLEIDPYGHFGTKRLLKRYFRSDW